MSEWKGYGNRMTWKKWAKLTNEEQERYSAQKAATNAHIRLDAVKAHGGHPELIAEMEATAAKHEALAHGKHTEASLAAAVATEAKANRMANTPHTMYGMGPSKQAESIQRVTTGYLGENPKGDKVAVAPANIVKSLIDSMDKLFGLFGGK